MGSGAEGLNPPRADPNAPQWSAALRRMMAPPVAA